MDINENNNLWQCSKVFLHTCPHVNHPSMRAIEPLLRGPWFEVPARDIKIAEQLCEHCPDFFPDR